MEQELARVTQGNALIQTGRKAEQYKHYLTEQKKSGTPVGNIDETVDFLLSQTDEQVTSFKKMLESQPKVALGITDEKPVNFDLETQQIQQDYKQHEDTYQQLGVTQKDLEYVRFLKPS